MGVWRFLTENPSDRIARRAAAVPARGGLPASDQDRRALLDDALMSRVAAGAVIEHRQDFEAVVRYDKRVNHVVHGILSLITLGAWLVVWLIVAFYARPARFALRVDTFGRVVETPLR